VNSRARIATFFGHRRRALIIAACTLAALALGTTLASAVAPVVSVEDATNVGYTTADVEGTVNPEGQGTTYRFQYATQADFSDAATGIENFTEASEPVSGQLTGLAPNTTYYLRLQAENGDGFSEAVAASTFTTKEVTPPAVSNVNSAEVAYTTAKATGEVEIANADEAFNTNSCRFEYLTDEQFVNEGNSFPTEGAPAVGCNAEPVTGQGTQPVAVEAGLAGLAPGSVYHLRLVASNLGGSDADEMAGTFETDPVAKPTVSGLASSAVTDSTAHVSGLVNPNAPKDASELEGGGGEEEAINGAFATHWSFSCSPECKFDGPGDGDLAADDDPAEVSADLTGLEPNKSYDLTLHATNAGGEETETVLASFTTDAIAPEIGTGTNTPEADGSVLVRAYVNPRNSAISECRFDYGLSTGYGESAPCETTPTTDNEAQLVTVKLAGLEKGKIFHFQVAATNGAGTGTSEDSVFVTPAEEQKQSCANEELREEQRSTFLPECRAYEMVSPPQKLGGDVMAHSTRTFAAADGDAVTFSSLQGFADVQGTGVEVEYMGQRSTDPSPGGNGWNVHAITPKQEAQTTVASLQGLLPLYRDFSDDLSAGLVYAWSPLTDDPNVAEATNLYVRDDIRTPGVGSYRLVTHSQTPVLPKKFGILSPAYAGASSDLSHVIFESYLALAPGATMFTPNLYESVGDEVRLVGVLPDSACGSPPCYTTNSYAGQGAIEALYTRHTISADGSRIVFTWRDQSIGSPPRQGRLYERVDGSTTVPVSASEKTNPDATLPARYWDASSDGERVFFTTSEQLLDSDHDEVLDLYMWRAEADTDRHHLTRISADRNPADQPNGTFGVIGASADGDYVYFISAGQIVPGQEPLAALGSSGNNVGLYLWQNGSVTFIAELSGSDDRITNLPGVWNGLEPLHARVSPDGDHLLFLARSGASLTGYNHGTECDLSVLHFVKGSRPCVELYTYDANNQQLACASCRPDGGPATSHALPYAQEGTGASLRTFHLSHALSDDGNRIFFNTRDSLVPEDTNGRVDAYLYDVPTATNHLLSTGTEKADSYFLDASKEGEDVFLATREQLTDWDIDQNGDLYDVRVGGGFPEPVIPPDCGGESCQGALGGLPSSADVGSAQVAGQGNPENPSRKPCRRGKRRITAPNGKVRCVKRHHPKKHRAANRNRRTVR